MWCKPEDVDELVQIGGLIRFSFPFSRPGGGGFKWRFENVDEQLRVIYDPVRMEERFRYFEKLCLHSLVRQTIKNFRIGVLVGEEMPAPYRTRLEALLSQLPQARIITLPVMPYWKAIRAAFDQLFDPDTPYRLSFRLDDDDAVATDFIEQVISRVPNMIALSGGLDPVALSFLQKVTLIGEGRDRRLVVSVDGHPIGIGLCVLAPNGHKTHAYSHIHSRVQMHMPALMESRYLMNLRAYHASNDSKITSPRGNIIPLSEAELKSALQTRFDLDMDKLLAL